MADLPQPTKGPIAETYVHTDNQVAVLYVKNPPQIQIVMEAGTNCAIQPLKVSSTNKEVEGHIWSLNVATATIDDLTIMNSKEQIRQNARLHNRVQYVLGMDSYHRLFSPYADDLRKATSKFEHALRRSFPIGNAVEKKLYGMENK